MTKKQRRQLEELRAQLNAQAGWKARKKIARLSDLEKDALQSFRWDVCEPAIAKQIDGSDEQDWFSLSLGFFVGRHVDPKRAHHLALIARYDLQYWHNDLTVADLDPVKS